MDRLAQIIRWLSKHPKSTIPQIATGCDFSDPYTESQVSLLRMSGFVVEEDAAKGKVYTVNQESGHKPG